MEIIKRREEPGHGINLFMVKENGKVKIKASTREKEGNSTFAAPLDVHVAVTNKCNMECEYCYAKDKRFLEQQDMSLQEVMDMIDKCNDANVFKLTWSGGEPLCRPDIFSILQYAGEKGFQQHMITNGMLLDKENVKWLKEFNVLVQISLHEISDAVFWEKCKLLVESGIDTVVDVVMEKNLLGKVALVVEMCRKVGIKKIKFGPIIPMGQAKGLVNIQEYKRVIEKLLGEISECRKDDIKIVTQFDRHEYRCAMQSLELRELLCEGASTLMYIDNNGDVYPCPLLKEYEEFKAGNIVRDSIESVWFADPMQEYRAISIEDTGCLDCGQICGVWCRGLTLAYTGDVKAHSPFCKNTRNL